jgi:hypothetical protein
MNQISIWYSTGGGEGERIRGEREREWKNYYTGEPAGPPRLSGKYTEKYSTKCGGTSRRGPDRLTGWPLRWCLGQEGGEAQCQRARRHDASCHCLDGALQSSGTCEF